MDRIIVDKKIMHGKPVVKGTRVPVEIVVGSLAGGMTYEEVENEYGVAREDILACLEYVTQLMRIERIYPLPTVEYA